MKKDEGLTDQSTGLSLIAQERDVVKVVDQIGVYQTIKHPFWMWPRHRRYSVRVEPGTGYWDRLAAPMTFWKMIHAQLAAGDLFTAHRRGYWEYRDRWHPVVPRQERDQPRGLSASEAPTSAAAVTPTPSEEIP